MKNTSELLSGDVYLLSALAALQKVVETLPHFLSPYLEGVLSQVSPETAVCYMRWQGKGKPHTESFHLFSEFLFSVWQEDYF